jgi:hypothetical protein
MIQVRGSKCQNNFGQEILCFSIAIAAGAGEIIQLKVIVYGSLPLVLYLVSILQFIYEGN